MIPAGDAGASWLLLLPLAAIVLSGAVKAAVVLSALRAAFGRSLPPRAVIGGLAIVLSLVATGPVVEEVLRDGASPAAGGSDVALRRSFEPVRRFLAMHAPAREQQSFLEIARRLRPPAARAAVTAEDLSVVAPAFMVGELRAAFQVAFLLLLPFLVLELVVASLLVALGMGGLDARLVSLPFKLLLFVAVDGWHLVARGLLASYG